MTSGQKNKVVITARVPPTLKRLLEELANKRQVGLSQLISELLGGIPDLMPIALGMASPPTLQAWSSQKISQAYLRVLLSIDMKLEELLFTLTDDLDRGHPADFLGVVEKLHQITQSLNEKHNCINMCGASAATGDRLCS